MNASNFCGSNLIELCTIARKYHQVRTILAQNLKGRSSSSAKSIKTIQPIGDRQNTRLLFPCRTNRHPVAFTKLFTRTDQSSRNIRCLIRFKLSRAKTWEEMRRVQVSISKHSQTDILWTHQPPSKKNTTTSNSTSHGQEVPNLAKVPIGSALARVHQPICSEHSTMATYLFHRSGLKTIVQFVS